MRRTYKYVAVTRDELPVGCLQAADRRNAADCGCFASTGCAASGAFIDSLTAGVYTGMPSAFILHIQDTFRSFAHKVALGFPDASFTYENIGVYAQRAIGLLHTLNLQRGDRIALQLEKSPEAVVLHLASMFLGSIHIPLNPRYTADEVHYILEDTKAKLLVRHGASGQPSQPCIEVLTRKSPAHYTLCHKGSSLAQLLDGCGPPAIPQPPQESDVALLCYTSGTTGRPKGAMLTYANLLAITTSLHESWGWTEDDVLLHTLPLFHVHGLLVALHGALYAGATTVLQPRFAADKVLERLSEGDCTIFMGVPTMYNRMVGDSRARAYRLGNMRLFISGSAPLSADTFYRFKERYGHTLLERYGMTETGIVLSNPLHGERRPGSVGAPLPGVEIRLVDSETQGDAAKGHVGEILIRGPTVFKGYWNKEAETQEAFIDHDWFRSGDLAYKDPADYYYLVGRTKELIITGGFNVYPREVEEVLARHEGVEEAAVFGQADPDLGELVSAAIVPKGPHHVTPRSLMQHCNNHLAAYKCPRQIYIMSTLPRNALGKVQKEILRSLV